MKETEERYEVDILFDVLDEVRKKVRAGDERLVSALQRLNDDADQALTKGPFSVMDKKPVPPSGDKHDYWTIAPYWWPNPDTKDGLPLILRDGHTNPEIEKYDVKPLNNMCAHTQTLALAYAIDGNEKYAERAAMFLRTWFIDKATCMNPNLEYAQSIAGQCEGRGAGIISTTALIGLLEGVRFLRKCDSWTNDDQQKLQEWFSAYLEWLLTSKNGKEERGHTGNHGIWFDAQATSYALFVGDTETARRIVEETGMGRITMNILSNGSHRYDLDRTQTWHYTAFTMRAFFILALRAGEIGIDLWHYEPEKGCCLQHTVEWILPYLYEPKAWRYPSIDPVEPGIFRFQIFLASRIFGEPRYRAALETLAAQAPPESRDNLLYPILE